MISVTDEGLGIDAENLKHIFKAFYKSDAHKSLNPSGVGVGLSIC